MVKTKSSSLCPGCKAPKKDHAFAAPSKHCAGPPVKQDITEDEFSDSDKFSPCQDISSSPVAGGSQVQLQSQQLLIDAMRNLSLQLEGLMKEQTTMKKRIDEISAGNAPTTTRETSSSSSGPSVADTLLPITHAPKKHHFPKKFAYCVINKSTSSSDFVNKILHRNFDQGLDKNDIRNGHWNVNHLTLDKFDQIKLFLLGKLGKPQLDVLLLNEMFLKPNVPHTLFEVLGYSIYHRDRVNKSGGGVMAT